MSKYEQNAYDVMNKTDGFYKFGNEKKKKKKIHLVDIDNIYENAAHA